MLTFFQKYYRPSDIDMTSESDSYDVLPARPAKYDTYSDDSYYVDEKYSRKPRPSHKHQSGMFLYFAFFSLFIPGCFY